MCNPCILLNESSRTSDTESTEIANMIETDKIYELQETVLTFLPREGKVSNSTSPNLPREISPKFDNKTKTEDPNLLLNDIRNENSERIIIGHLNVNHIENKFEPLVSLVKDKLDIILLSETKIDQSFPSSQFEIEGYTKPFRRDRDIHDGGLLIYVRDDIPCKELKPENLPDDIECVFTEINLRNRKWLLMGTYNPHQENISYFLTHVSKALDKLLANNDNFLLIGDFNASVSESNLKDFCEVGICN